MKIENIGLILGIVGSLILAAVALYRARPQHELDSVTKDKVEQEVKIAAERHENDKTIRIMRLENYVTKDVSYHRKTEIYQAKQNAYQEKLLALLERCVDASLLHNGDIPEAPGDPPEPPELPDLHV